MFIGLESVTLRIRVCLRYGPSQIPRLLLLAPQSLVHLASTCRRDFEHQRIWPLAIVVQALRPTIGDINDWAGMREDCTQAIRLRPNSADLYNLRGTACFRLEDYDAALDDYDRSIALDNQRYESYFNRGLVKQRQMNLEEALVDFRRALGLNPRFEAATRGITSLERYLAKVYKSE